MAPFLAVPMESFAAHASMSPEFITEMSKHVQGLANIYEWGYANLKWRCIAGALAAEGNIEIHQLDNESNPEEVLKFMSDISDEIDRCKNMNALVLNNGTRKYCGKF